jgi:hypothetical protein
MEFIVILLIAWILSSLFPKRTNREQQRIGETSTGTSAPRTGSGHDSPYLLGHDFSERDICSKCGNSRLAVEVRGWACKGTTSLSPSEKNSGANPPVLRSNGPAAAGRVAARDVNPPASPHAFGVGDVCMRCGCSRGAVERFGWACKGPSPERQQPSTTARARHRTAAKELWESNPEMMLQLREAAGKLSQAHRGLQDSMAFSVVRVTFPNGEQQVGTVESMDYVNGCLSLGKGVMINWGHKHGGREILDYGTARMSSFVELERMHPLGNPRG